MRWARLPIPPGYIVASGTLPPGVGSDFHVRVGQLCRQMGARLIRDSSGEGLPGCLGRYAETGGAGRRGPSAGQERMAAECALQ